jgi:hypothetical protein
MNISKKIKNALFCLVLISISVIMTSQKAKAADLCGLLPCDQYDINDVTNVNDRVENLVKYGLSAIFIVIIAIGIYQIIRAALKIVRSEGKQEDLEGGINILKGVWIGVGLFFVGLIGLIIILALLDSGGIVSTDVNDPPGVDLPFID